MFRLDLEKAEEPEIKLPTSVGSSKKQESYRKTYTSALLTTPKPLTVDRKKLWEILQETGILDHLTCLLRNVYACQEATEPDMGQQTGVYCHPAYLTYMHSTSYEMQDWMKNKLESRFPGEK